MKNWLKRTWALLFPIILVVLVIDWAIFLIALTVLALVGLVLLFFDFIFDNRTEWGLFPTFSIDETLKMATSTPLSAALVWLGWVAIIITTLILVSSKAGAAEYKNDFIKYSPVLSQTIKKYWSNAPLTEIMFAQVEQESSWKEKATLNTKRELGRGLVQLTIAYTKEGKERFNAYKDAVDQYTDLKGWNWQAEPYNVRYQLAYLVLRNRSAYKQMSKIITDNPEEIWKTSLVSYNAGTGRVMARRKNAQLMGYNKNIWADNLENSHGPEENKILYKRPLWVAVNEYPEIIFKKSKKYAGL